MGGAGAFCESRESVTLPIGSQGCEMRYTCVRANVKWTDRSCVLRDAYEARSGLPLSCVRPVAQLRRGASGDGYWLSWEEDI